MKRIAAIAVMGLLPLVASASPSEVTNVEVSYQDGATVARIDVKGSIRFTHETEVPKNGRPHRVIIDILAATHELGAKEFLQLPPCVITGVRTSQYAVTPEKVVRVVFDLTGAPLYRIDSNDRAITVWFDHKGVKSFKTWSSSAVVAAARAKSQPVLAVRSTGSPTKTPSLGKTTQVAKQNQAIESDRLASLASKPTEPKQSLVTEKPKSVKTPLKTSDRRFSARTFSEKPTSPKPEPVEKQVKGPEPVKEVTSPPPVAVAAAETKAKAPGKKDQPATKPVVTPEQKSPVKAKADAKAAQPKAAPSKVKPAVQKTVTRERKAVPSPVPADKFKANLAANTAPKPAAQKKIIATQAPKPAAEKKTTVAQAPKPATRASAKSSQKDVQAKSQKSTRPKTAKGQQALAQKLSISPTSKSQPAKVAGKSTAPKQRSTARFRRKVPSAKIRGTMVAEFPKRLVIKYKTGGRRDPFGSLVDSKRTYNDPIETRIPNVEGLKLVGVLDSDGDSNRALFEDKMGFSYILKAGDKVRNGYVLRIETSQVYFQIFEYGWSRTVALTME